MTAGWVIREEGDAALLITPPVQGALGRRAVLGLHRALAAGTPAGVVDWIHAPDSILVLLDPLGDAGVVTAAIRALARGAGAAPEVPGRLIELPVRFGGLDGPDLEESAALATTSTAALVEALTARPLRVAALGGNALPLLLADEGLPIVPRLASPRPAVPAGSIGLAGDRACVYPVTMPGGWRLVGRTDRVLVDPAADPVGLLRAGDRVRLIPA